MKVGRAIVLIGGALMSARLLSRQESTLPSCEAPKTFQQYDKEYLDFVSSIWQKTVDTQMHFNEISVKSRQLGLTFVAAALGLAVFLFSRSASDARFSFHIVIGGLKWSIHVAEIVVLGAAAAVYAVKQLDLGVYHRMLRGAVTFGEDRESRHMLSILDMPKGMTQAISHFSRYKDASRKFTDEGIPAYTGNEYKNAGKKISKFYTIVITFLILAAIFMFGIDNYGA